MVLFIDDSDDAIWLVGVVVRAIVALVVVVYNYTIIYYVCSDVYILYIYYILLHCINVDKLALKKNSLK